MPSSWGNLPHYGEYEILGAQEGKPRLLGEGSFGKTFEAIRKDTIPGKVHETHFAVKVLNPAFTGSEARRVQLAHELQALTALDHPNLISCFRGGIEKGEVYYVMRLCRGGDLDQLVRRYGKLPERVVARIALQVATGLRELEHHGLVHRDIKPSNIMLAEALEPNLALQHLPLRFENRENLCRIVDFGLVDIASHAREGSQGSGGTPMYASPEQICRQAVDKRSDIYSLGMTLWFLLQGKGPFLNAQGQSVDKAEAYRRQTTPTAHDADLPGHLGADFRAILTRMIAKQPERRFANATLLLRDLRRYLTSAETVEDTKFAVTQILQPLEEEYAIQGSYRWRGGKVHFAMQGEAPIRIIVVADLHRRDPSVDLEALTERLCEFGELSQEPGLPAALLPVREVIRTADLLACTEPSLGQTSLAEVLRARSKKKNSVPFAEAVSILGPISEALDFLLQHKQVAVFLSANEIWVSGRQLLDAPKDHSILARPVTEWEDFRLAFSMVCPRRASEEEASSATTTSHHTTTGSLQLSEWDLHPVPAFVRLVYRILNGAEVALATQFAPGAFVPAVTLGAASNHLLRDLLCRQRPWGNVASVFRELCVNEGIDPSLLPSPPPSPLLPLAPPTKRDGSSGGAKGSSYRSPVGPSDEPCEVVRPGFVISPYDPERREQEVPAALWLPSGQVPCQFTRKAFRLPVRLDLLVARVIAPGLVQSPFDRPNSSQSVPLAEWAGGAEVLCKVSGKRFALPYNIPLPEGLRPSKKGDVVSPYDNVTSVEVAPSFWEPGGEVHCPRAKRVFVLPQVLPPLLAVADITRPGVLISPYAQGKTLPIAPKDWLAGGTFACPVSGKRLEVPPEVEQWAAPATLMDISRRLVSNPYRAEEPIEVEPSSWKPGGRVRRPGARQFVALPNDLPPLVGQIDQPGFVRSPYSGQTIPVPPHEWVAGGRVRCPTHQWDLVLPSKLPEWIPVGNCERLAPGRVRSPFEPYKVEAVPPLKWKPNETIICSITKKPFRLPQNLPKLEGTVKAGKAGSVCSPFAPSEWQDVPFEEWNEGQELQCKATQRTFVLPAKLEEWVPDGEWVHLDPGRIRFPYKPHGEVQMTPEQWKPGQILVCPGTKYRFRVPITPALPSIEFEGDAIQHALTAPNDEPLEAAEALKSRHSAATEGLVKAVWKRHHLETRWERCNAVQRAKPIDGRPGVVRSPYDPYPEFEVRPDDWAPGAILRCPTGKRCRLPDPLPPLLAELAPGPPGFVISPFAPGKRWPIPPDDWQKGCEISCPSTGKTLQMPALPPDWLPKGAVKEDRPGVATSPFRHQCPVPVSGSQWFPGSRIVCQETGRIFLLPAKLPPLTAKLVENRTGVVATPYAVNRIMPVRHALWKAGNKVVCKVTKRVFLLPSPLPDWKKRSSPWKLVTSAAAIVGLVVGLGLGMGKMRLGGSTPTGDVAVDATITGTLEVDDWPAGQKPISLKCNDVPCTDVRAERGKLIVNQVTVPLKFNDAAGSYTVNWELPGWTSAVSRLQKNKAGDFVLLGNPVLHRQMIRQP